VADLHHALIVLRKARKVLVTTNTVCKQWIATHIRGEACADDER
jgi:hypothetical protein